MKIKTMLWPVRLLTLSLVSLPISDDKDRIMWLQWWFLSEKEGVVKK